jgi:hypothetical protein
MRVYRGIHKRYVDSVDMMSRIEISIVYRRWEERHFLLPIYANILDLVVEYT